MADLNALIAQGYQFQAPPDPFAQYAKMQQLNVGQNQNALAQYQLAQAQRTDQEANALRQSLPAEFDLNNPSHVNAVLRASPVGGASLIEKLARVRNDMLNGKKTEGEIAAQPGARAETEARTNSLAAKTLDENLGNFNKIYSPLAAASAGAKGVQDYVTAMYNHPILGSVASAMKPLDAALQENLSAFQADPRKWIAAHSQLNGQGILDTMKGTRQNVNLGGTNQGQTIDVYGNVVPGSTTNTSVTNTPFQAGELAIGNKRNQISELQANAPQYMVTDQGVVALPKNPKSGAITGSVVIGPSGEPLQKELKPIPASINTAIITNNQGIKSIDEAIRLIKENPDAVGWKGYAPNKLLNEANPEGVDARAAISNIGSLKLHERSGAAVTASEFPRLAPFIPLATDDSETVLKKLKQMKTIAQGEQQGLTETYTKDQGYRSNPILNPKNAPAAAPVNSSNVVVTPDGQSHTFPTPAAAAQFKKAAGIQ